VNRKFATRHQACKKLYDLGFAEDMSPLPIRISYRFRVSDSLLLSEMNIVVLPPSRMMGYFPISDPDKSFESGTFNRCRSIIILCSKVSFFMIRLFCLKT
jgi:hypothetical protein